MINVITDNAKLECFCTALAHETFITVDTEFMREKTYYPQLCLIQVAGEKESAIIDPLAPGINLDALFRLFENPAILKVFHACRQDMEIFYQAMGKLPAPVFDTQVAAMVCGYGESASYETLVNKILRASVDKSSRFTDWSRRPLTEKQLTYALDDVLHLREIYKVIAQQLQESGRVDWIQEETAPLTDTSTYDNNPNDAWQRLRFRNTTPRYLATLQAVARWRELTARERNVPRGRIMKDETLTEVASAKPTSFTDLQAIRGFHPTLQTGQYSKLFDAMKAVESLPSCEYPRLLAKPQFLPEVETLVDLLRLLLKNCAAKKQLVPRLIADKEELELLASGNRDGLHVLQGWRHDIFGQHAVRLLEGKILLKADKTLGIAFIETVD